MLPWMNIMIFSMIICLSVVLTLSSNSPLPIWFSMELNTSAIIPIIALTNKKDKSMAMKYQIINSFAALLFIFAAINMYMSPFKEIHIQLMFVIMMVSMIMKLALFPFNLWFISLIKNINWYAIFLMTSIQKIIPMLVIMWMEKKINLSLIFILISMNAMIASMGALSSNSMKMIIGFSSISYSSWLTLIILYNQISWNMAILIYIVNMILITKLLSSKKINLMIKSSKEKSMTLSLIMMNLGGLPPMAGFAMKIIIIQSIMNSNINWMISFTLIILMFSTLITMFIYMKMISSSMMKYSLTMMWKSKSKNSEMKIIIIMFMMLPIILLW